jgi:hypothetical protein
MMDTPAVHHLVTIRLDEHVEQLERAYSAFLDVRTQLSDLHDSLDGSRAAAPQQSAGLEGTLARIRGVLRTVGSALDMVSPVSGELL